MKVQSMAPAAPQNDCGESQRPTATRLPPVVAAVRHGQRCLFVISDICRIENLDAHRRCTLGSRYTESTSDQQLIDRKATARIMIAPAR